MMLHDACARVRRGAYGLNFLIYSAVALTTYFNTPLLLERGISEGTVGLVFSLAALLAIVALWIAPFVLNRFGSYVVLATLVALYGLSFVVLAASTSALIAASATLVQFTSVTAGLFVLDLILEAAMPFEGMTGRVRGFFITMANIAWVVAPFLAGMLTSAGGFALLYTVSAALFVPALFLIRYSFHDLRPHRYEPFQFIALMAPLVESADTRRVFAAQFLLRLFFSIMAMYLSVYFLKYLNISFGEMGLILSIAMLAYVVIEMPAGKLADLYWGEKELMMAGFVVTGLATMFLTFTQTSNILIIAAILFATRIGAALLDITTESYFFKRVGGDDADDVGAFRMLFPIASIIGPLVGSALLFILPLPWLFAVLGIVMFLGIPIASGLRDTR